MCGIAGIVNFHITPLDVAVVRAMAARLRHRGPDDEGYYHDRDAALGHTRLSVIDLKSGRQPIFNEQGNIAIVYNGEIYNFRELKEDLLSRGHRFRTNTDTEVVVHAYEEFGLEAVERFNGMFAFALWDAPRKRALFARDRLGIKPLYYFWASDSLVFASEIKALLAHPEMKPAPDARALVDFLTFQNMLDAKTFFRGVYKLLPSQCLIWEQGKEARLWKYWEPDFIKSAYPTVDDYIARYLDTFHRAVKRHLISDVPLGSYLSGGFDSSSVAALAAEHSEGALQTFTGAFGEGEQYDERPCAREVAEKIGAVRHELVITPRDFLDSIEKIVYHLDEPYLGMASFPGYHVSRLVSRHVKVVLTGHGGDELFGGYPVYKAAYLKGLANQNVSSFIRNLIRIRPHEIPRLLYFGIYPLFERDLRFGLYIMFNRRERGQLFSEDFQREMAGYQPLDILQSMVEKLGLDPNDQLIYLYLRTYLPTLFLIEDKVGMAHSIEARTPICDNEMVQLGTTKPIRFKLFGLEPKAVPRRAMKGILPASLYRQPKRGFPTPLHLWFRRELKDFAYDTLLSSSGLPESFFNRRFIQKLLDDFSAGKQDNLFSYNTGSRIYSLICIALWFKIFIHSPETPPMAIGGMNGHAGSGYRPLAKEGDIHTRTRPAG